MHMLHMCITKSEKALSRKKFAMQLSEGVLAPWMKEHYNISTLLRPTRTIIRKLLKLDLNIQPPERSHKEKRKICAFRPYSLRTMTPNFYHACSRVMHRE
ncbi:hypothetical protein X975_17791, partial [Stegodyphus mimosarum]